jgi:TPR repeat protein
MTGIELARSGAAPEVLLREAERRMQLGGDHRNDALLLMQVAADRNYAPAHAALGRFYDPDLPHPPDIQSDEHQAALQYHAAAQGGDNSVAEARAALKAYLEQRAGLGDVFAPQILRDFWP